MKVLHVTPSFYPAKGYGGPIYSGYALCNALTQDSRIDLRVLTTDSDGPQGDRFPVKSFPDRSFSEYDVYYCRRVLGADIAPGLFLRLLPMVQWSEIVHLNAVYSPTTIPTLALCKMLRKPVVWSVRGALQRWTGSTRTRLKGTWNRVCDLFCEPDRVALHVTSVGERQSSSAALGRAAFIELPNGVDIPVAEEREFRPCGRLRLLYLGRLHPIKGIEHLLQAMSLLEEHVTLSVCGQGPIAYEEKLKSLVEELSLDGRVSFRGLVSANTKRDSFRNADICIVPSFTENFGLVVAESLAAGVPVIASTGTPWSRIQDLGCGLWVDNSPENLADAARCLAELPLADMGSRGREWMRREFSWSAIAQQMLSKYDTLIQMNSDRSSQTVRQPMV